MSDKDRSGDPSVQNEQEPRPPRDLQEMVSPWIDEALDRYAPTEHVAYAWGLLPNQGNPAGMMLPTIMFYFRGALLGSICPSFFQITNGLNILQDEVFDVIRGIVENVNTQRSTDLRQMTNGHGEGMPPLTLP